MERWALYRQSDATCCFVCHGILLWLYLQCRFASWPACDFSHYIQQGMLPTASASWRNYKIWRLFCWETSVTSPKGKSTPTANFLMIVLYTMLFVLNRQAYRVNGSWFSCFISNFPGYITFGTMSIFRGSTMTRDVPRLFTWCRECLLNTV